MKTKFLTILLISVLSVFLVSATVSALTLEELAQDSYEKCTSTSISQCVVSLNAFRQEVRGHCQNYEIDQCMEGLERFWVTTSKIGKAGGHFVFALTDAYSLTMQAYADPQTAEETTTAFNIVAPEPYPIDVDLSTDNVCYLYTYANANISQTVNSAGTITTEIKLYGKLYDGGGSGPGVMTIHSQGGNCDATGLTVQNGVEAPVSYSTMQMNYYKKARSYIRMDKYTQP